MYTNSIFYKVRNGLKMVALGILQWRFVTTLARVVAEASPERAPSVSSPPPGSRHPLIKDPGFASSTIRTMLPTHRPALTFNS